MNPMEPNTIFDKILARKIPADIVFEDEHVMAIRDICPQAPQHVLVIPKQRVSRFAELANRPADEVGSFFCRVAKIAQLLKLEKDGFRIVINNGEHAGQTVEYLHAHILGGAPLRSGLG
jgi:histidine triad (HIT) family protein